MIVCVCIVGSGDDGSVGLAWSVPDRLAVLGLDCSSLSARGRAQRAETRERGRHCF